MPRYPQTVADRPSPRDKKLSQLAALQSLEGPQMQQQELASREQQQRVAQAMQMLGLQQQQQNATAEQALRERQLTQSGQQFDQTQRFAQQQADDRSGQFWGGTLPLQYTEQAGLEADRKARQDLATKSFNDESGYRWKVKAPLDFAEQATREAQAKAAAEHYKDMINIQASQQALLIDPMGGGPLLAAGYLRNLPGSATAEKVQLDLQNSKIEQQVQSLLPALRVLSPTERKMMLDTLPMPIQMRLAPQLEQQGAVVPQAELSPTMMVPPGATQAVPVNLPGPSQPFSLSDYYTPPDHPDATATTGNIHPFDFLRDVYRTGTGKPALGPNRRYEQARQQSM